MNEEQEDFNAFNSWDCFGATLMLALVPAVMNFVFTDPHEVGSTVAIGVTGLLISLAVLALALITRWRIIGKIVNLAGCILTPVYIVIAVCAFWPSEEAPAPEQPAAEHPVAPH